MIMCFYSQVFRYKNTFYIHLKQTVYFIHLLICIHHLADKNGIRFHNINSINIKELQRALDN